MPYVFGGANPSGFDCSGFIMFVYAQYGVNLPHSVHAQDGIGTPISQADAQPGDVVVFNDDSHDGFYAGNGMILHAPYPGARVRVQKLWTSDVHFDALRHLNRLPPAAGPCGEHPSQCGSTSRDRAPVVARRDLA